MTADENPVECRDVDLQPIERRARKPKRRLDVVERDPVIRRRSIGRGLADEFVHASFGPLIIRDFKLCREARERDSHEPMVAEIEHMIKVIIIHVMGRAVWTQPLGPRRPSRLDDFSFDLPWRRHRFAVGPLGACRVGSESRG